MAEERSSLRFVSPRAERLVEAWNRSDVAYILDQLGDDIVLEARLPRMPVPAKQLAVRSKAEFSARLTAYAGPLPRFRIVSAIEGPSTICLVLSDAAGDLLSVTIEFEEDGLFQRITSYRPDKT